MYKKRINKCIYIHKVFQNILDLFRIRINDSEIFVIYSEILRFIIHVNHCKKSVPNDLVTDTEGVGLNKAWINEG